MQKTAETRRRTCPLPAGRLSNKQDSDKFSRANGDWHLNESTYSNSDRVSKPVRIPSANIHYRSRCLSSPEKTIISAIVWLGVSKAEGVCNRITK